MVICRTIARQKNEKIVKLSFGAEMRKLVSIVLLSVSLCACDGPRTWPTEQFDAARWRATPEQERYQFAQDLVSSKRLIGRSKSEVTALLGPPSSESELPGLTYVIKVGGSGFDQVFILDIRFADGKVNEVLIRGD